MNKVLRKTLKNNKGATIADLTIAIIIVSVLAGLIANLLYNNYKVSLDVLHSSNVSAYATLIMEKVDEKTFEEVDDNFISNFVEIYSGDELDNLETGKIYMEENYSASINVDEIEGYQIDEQPIYKEVVVTVYYHKQQQDELKLILKKLKVKEMDNLI